MEAVKSVDVWMDVMERVKRDVGRGCIICGMGGGYEMVEVCDVGCGAVCGVCVNVPAGRRG